MLDFWKEIIVNVQNQKSNQDAIEKIKKITFQDTTSHLIAFGTSGWRSIIGKEYTIYMVQKLTSSIVELYQQNNKSLQQWGIVSFEELQKKGIVLGHDNRLFGFEFSLAVHTVLNSYGIPVFYAGEATTPELSAAVVQNDYAASINLTPSHNPAPYGGYKFNAKDGGPAEEKVTNSITKICNEESSFDGFELLSEPKWKVVDSLQIYREFVQDRKVLDLDFCISEVKKEKVALAIDPFYGSSKGKIFKLLDRPLYLKQFHTDQDFFFKGHDPEPNIKNLEELKIYLDSQPHQLKLGGIMDPDGDRVLFYDGHQVIPMNQFGAIAFHYFITHLNKVGGVAKSVATSDFVKFVAKKLNSNCYETAIGFKNFRKYLEKGSEHKALICFEESDGISAYGHTKEKDALFGYLLAIEITMRLKKPLSVYLSEIQKEVGMCFPLKKGIEITEEKMLEVKSHIKLLTETYCLKTVLKIQGKDLEIIDFDLTDGTKWILEDGSWFLIRPSGTESKIRIYTEGHSLEQSQALFNIVKEWF